MSTFYWSDELYHHGVKGQRWGIRRYQNADGSLTELGRKHYDIASKKEYDSYRELEKKYGRNTKEYEKAINEETYSSRLGKKALGEKYLEENNNLQNKWYDVLSDIYDSNYSNYKGHGKKEWLDQQAKKKEASDIMDAEWSKAQQESVKQRSLIKKATDALLGRKYSYFEESQKKVENSERYKKARQELDTAIDKIDKLEKKMRGIWKDKTLREIIKEIPEKDREAAYMYFRYFNYDYD